MEVYFPYHIMIFVHTASPMLCGYSIRQSFAVLSFILSCQETYVMPKLKQFIKGGDSYLVQRISLGIGDPQEIGQ